MADALTSAELARRVPEPSWTSGSPANDGDQWFAVLEFDENRKALVLTRSARWAWVSTGTDGESRLHRLQPPDVVGALPTLELDPLGLASKLTCTAIMLQVKSQDLVAALPTLDLFIAAFETKSDYWIDRALSWLEAGNWPKVPVAAMQAVVEDPSVGQRTRHRTRRLLSMQTSG